MKKIFRRIKRFVLVTFNLFKRYGFYFAPGVFSILLAIGIFFFPDATVILGAAFFLFLGVMFCLIAWKLLVVKARIESLIRNNVGHVIVHGVGVREDPFDLDDFDGIDSKKVIFH